MPLQIALQGLGGNAVHLEEVGVAAVGSEPHRVAGMKAICHELTPEVDENAVDKVRTRVVQLMEGAADLDVDLKVDAGTGSNWDEAH